MTSRLPDSHPASLSTWRAELHLGFARAGERTVLRENRHCGPLRVQKALYPEGDSLCQAIVLHPPSGIAGGDHLDIHVAVDVEAQAQITTPGAGKWYRSAGAEAAQHIHLRVDQGATLEWLPQETIVFNGARAHMETRVTLAADSRFIGWDILCLGRAAAGERFEQGHFELFYRVDRAETPIWLERGGLLGNDPMLTSPAGWAGCSVAGTLLCTFPALSQQAAALLEACRTYTPGDQARHGITVMPAAQGGMLIARYLGDNSEAARHWFTMLWQVLRPACSGRPAIIPRIWHT